jgi:hypothetical protein
MNPREARWPMEERRRQRREQSSHWAGRWLILLERDTNLAARAGGTVASAVAAGGAALLTLPLLVAADSAAMIGWTFFGGVFLLGLSLIGLLLARRRAPSEAIMAPRRARLAVGMIALGLFGVGLFGGARSLSFALGGGIIGALLVVASGFWTYGFVASLIVRVAHDRRQAWYAQIRASRLTRRMLGYAAYRQLRREGALPVQSGLHPSRTYLVPIRTTPSGARILVLEGQRPIGGLCLRPRQPLPDPEEALAHIMAIRTDERAWLDRANFFPQDRTLTPQALGLAPGRPGNYER